VAMSNAECLLITTSDETRVSDFLIFEKSPGSATAKYSSRKDTTEGGSDCVQEFLCSRLGK
jgi:hypothetical protein